jgi:hypothetical protein
MIEEEQVPEEQPPPAGIDLVPAAPPTNIFQEPEPQEDVPPEEFEPPPPGAPEQGAFNTRNASSTSAVASPRMALSSLRRERYAEEPGPQPAAVRLRLVPGVRQVEMGETFTVRIEAAAVRPVSHLPIALSWDPKRLAVEEFEAGAFLGPPGTAQVLADGSRPGRLTVGASRLGDRPPIAGEGTVATVTFRALVAGPARIGFGTTQALDAALKPVLPLRTEVATIQVRPPHREEAPAPPAPPAPPARPEG